jgi:hypothetical protein
LLRFQELVVRPRHYNFWSQRSDDRTPALTYEPRLSLSPPRNVEVDGCPCTNHEGSNYGT